MRTLSEVRRDYERQRTRDAEATTYLVEATLVIENVPSIRMTWLACGLLAARAKLASLQPPRWIGAKIL